jgi:hypothetical protein
MLRAGSVTPVPMLVCEWAVVAKSAVAEIAAIVSAVVMLFLRFIDDYPLFIHPSEGETSL